LPAWPKTVTDANNIAQTSTQRHVSLFENNRLAFIFFSLGLWASVMLFRDRRTCLPVTDTAK
jgi:hypothetical protein